MATDRYGLAMSGSEAAIAHFNRGLSHLVRFQAEIVTESEAAIQADPGCVMARVFRAYVGAMSSEWPDTRAAAEFVSGAAPTNDRERAPLAAGSAGAGGDIHAAGRILDGILADHPRDLLALAVGHQVDFLTGDARNLRGRVERVRPRFSSADPDASFLDGMWSFGLEECGDYARAEEAGLRSVATNANDVWGIHAVVHTYEMQGRVADACLQLHGGWGYMREMAIGRAWVDARQARLAGGSIEIMKLISAKQIMPKTKSA